MKYLVLAGIISLFFIFPAFADTPQTEVTFVSSYEELTEAMRSEKPKGLAIRSEFYNGAGNAAKDRIGQLIIMNLNRLVPIFFYGYDINAKVVLALFGGEGNAACKPMVMTGIFWTVPISGELRGAHVEMCSASDENLSEEFFREWINSYWLETKIALNEKGYATLP